jgi:hypothetical protein
MGEPLSGNAALRDHRCGKIDTRVPWGATFDEEGVR